MIGKHKIIIGVAVLALLLVSGCISQTGKADDGRITQEYSDSFLTVYHDNLLKVTIYYDHINGGITAVPDKQINR